MRADSQVFGTSDAWQRFASGACLLHALYLVHYGLSDFYGLACRKGLRRCKMRTDYSTIEPLFLEWIHTLETATVVALTTPYAIAGAVIAGLCALRIGLSDRRSVWVSRKLRLADLISASLALKTKPVVVVHVHAAIVPYRILFQQGSRPSLYLLLAFHVVGAFLGWSRYGIPAAIVVFIARDLGHALNETDDDVVLRGWARNYAALSTDLRPRTWFFSEGLISWFDAALSCEDLRQRIRPGDPSPPPEIKNTDIETTQPLTTMPD